MSISLVNLTMNRRDLVEKAYAHNKSNCGHPWDELVWVDNGSTDGTAELAKSLNPDVLILNKRNQGVSRAINRAFACCTCDWIALPGDRNLMPDKWLKMWAEIIDTRQADVVSIYTCDYSIPVERHLPGDIQTLAGYRCRPGLAFDTIIFARSILSVAGYWREDFGMYGWNDVEWAARLKVRNIRTLVMLDHFVTRSPDVPIDMDGVDYRKWRDDQINSPSTHAKLHWCEEHNFPYYNPFR